MKRLVLCLALAACTPDFEDAPWRVDAPRVLAIVAEPPEARPSEVVQLSALIADVEGPVSGAPAWSVCTRPRAASERTAVTQRCLEGESLDPVSASMSLLADACARFGPNVPPADGDATPQRPSDPDSSGGYFLPLRAETPDARAFGAVRIRCDLPGVTRRIFDAFEERYATNANPGIAAVAVGDIEMRTGLDTVPSIGREDIVPLEVILSPEAAEPYVRYDAPRGVLVDEREWLRVQWFVTDGLLDRGLAVIEPTAGASLRAAAVWTAPPDPGRVHGWIVVTDARGGAAWHAFALDVE